MQHEELIHRFFDEGLEDSLQDVLFESMARDGELRNSFLEHVKLQGIVQDDLAAITTPAHVERSLMVSLGLELPLEVGSAGTSAFATLMTAMKKGGGLIAARRGYFVTAGITAVATVLLMLLIGVPFQGNPDIDVRISQAVNDQPAPESLHHDDPTGFGTSEEKRDAGDVMPVSRASLADVPPVSKLRAHALPASNTGEARIAAATETTVGAKGVTVQSRDGEGVLEPNDIPPIRQIFGVGITADPEEMSIDGIPEPDIPEQQWHLFRRSTQLSVLSNLVFELRKMYGKSNPDVQLPHNSHTVFENMGISALYKISDHHAFGFEYGRESYGQEYKSFAMANRDVDPTNTERIYDPPVPWMAAEFRENRMLDVIGAVWKLSLPEYGMFNFIYPYSRTFLGATTQGPVGRLQLGLEMFPSNYSMLNLGVEFGALHYYVEQVSYNSTKISFTFGVAIGF